MLLPNPATLNTVAVHIHKKGPDPTLKGDGTDQIIAGALLLAAVALVKHVYATFCIDKGLLSRKEGVT